MGKNIGGGYVYTEGVSSASYADDGFSVESLNDVEVTNPENGQVLAYDSSTEKWVNSEAGGDSGTIAGLTDVYIINPTNGQTLVYNTTSGKWENGAAGGGASLIMPNINITMTGVDTGTATCDMTRAAIVSAIENGAICIARITGGKLDQGSYRFVTDVGVAVYDDDDVDDAVVFTTYDLVGGGDVEWTTIVISDTEIVCRFDHTNSYPSNTEL